MALLLLTVALFGCERQVLYSHFEHTSSEGWAKDDTVSFCYIATGEGLMSEELGLRMGDAYPFTAVTLVVEQQVSPAARESGGRATGLLRHDTIDARLVNEEGDILGNGIHYYQYAFPVTQIPLHRGDTLRVNVRHHMRREVLPSIYDVGLTLKVKR